MWLTGNIFCQIKPIINDESKLNYIPEYYRELDSNNLAIKINTLSYPNSLKQLMKAPYKNELTPFWDNYLSKISLISAGDVSSIIKNNLNLSEFYRISVNQESPALLYVRKYLGISKNVSAVILLVMHILTYH